VGNMEYHTICPYLRPSRLGNCKITQQVRLVAGNSATESTLTGNQRKMKGDARSIEHDQRGGLLDDDEEGGDRQPKRCGESLSSDNLAKSDVTLRSYASSEGLQPDLESMKFQ